MTINDQKNNLEKKIETNSEITSLPSFSECLRKWEPYQQKGSDPNETRMLDIFECWAGEQEMAIGLVGIPFDSAVLGRKGAKGGPKKIRDSLRYYKAYSWFLDFWFGDKKVYDFGDIITEEETVEEAHQTISSVISKIVERGFVTITLGGDHSIGYPIIEGVLKAKQGKKIGLINVDAHLDVRELVDGKINSGTPFRRILENNLVDGENFVEIGIRDFANARAYRKYVEEHLVTVFTMDDIRRKGIQSIISESIEIITCNTDATYLSIDMDSLDQIYAPGVSAPTPDGLNPQQITQIIHQVVTNTDIYGMDIVELNPLYDTADTTAINAANFVVQFVASYYWKQSRERY